MTHQPISTARDSAPANNRPEGGGAIQEAAMNPPAVYGLVADVMLRMSKEGIGKDRKNQQQNYNFRGIDDVYNALSSVLAENRLVMLPYVAEMRREERQTKSGGALNYTILTVDFTLVAATDGSRHVVRTIGEAMDAADKSANKAQSAALKYAAIQVFMIPTEGDNDADATTHEVAARQPAGDLTERASRVYGALRNAPDAAALEKAWGLASELCAKLSTESPDKLDLLTRLYEARKADLTQSTPFDEAA